MFDPLVCHNVMKFLEIWDWPIIKPFLISKSFNEAFLSEPFAKDVLRANMKLNDEEFERSEMLCEQLRGFYDEMQERVCVCKEDECDDDDDDDLPSADEEDVDLEEVCNDQQYEPPKPDLNYLFQKAPNSLVEIMKVFVALNLRFGIERLNSNLANAPNFERGNAEDTDLKLLEGENEKATVRSIMMDSFIVPSNFNMINKRLEKLLPNSIPITRKLVTDILAGPNKDIFVIEGDTINSKGRTCRKMEMVVFTWCGYPLVLSTDAETNSDGYDEIFESLSCYKFDLFFNRRNGTKVQSTPSFHLNLLQTVIMKENVDETLLEAGCLEDHLELFKNFIIYIYFQGSFGSRRFFFLEKSKSWLPFLEE